MPLTTDLEDLC